MSIDLAEKAGLVISDFELILPSRTISEIAALCNVLLRS
jgi:hypothetical protein